VVKPDDGVGCEGTLIIRDPAQFQTLAGMEGWIVQPLLEGEAISLSVLFANGRARLLSCNRQRIERAGGGFVLKGVSVNAIPDHDGSLQTLAESIARSMPELWGYAGIDLILTDDGPVILEINPRLTTSYAGLRLATGENPAAWVLHLLTTGQLLPVPSRKGKPVEIHLEKSSGL
jgi:predicted ATP-grasp superfamily ATP-dependent carboligase